MKIIMHVDENTPQIDYIALARAAHCIAKKVFAGEVGEGYISGVVFGDIGPEPQRPVVSVKVNKNSLTVAMASPVPETS